MTQKLKNTSLILITILLLAAYVNSQTQISPWIAARPEAGIIFLSLIATPVLFGMVAAAYFLEWMGSMIGLYIQRKKEAINNLKVVVWTVVPPAAIYPLGIILYLCWFFSGHWNLLGVDEILSTLLWYFIIPTILFTLTLTTLTIIIYSITSFIEKMLEKKIKNRYLLHTLSMLLLYLITVAPFLLLVVV